MKLTAKTIIQLIIVIVILPLLPMIISGRWDWWEAWVYALALILGFIVSRALAARAHPGILKERSDSFDKKDAKPWDRVLAPAMAFGGMVIPIIAGLEERFNWTPEPYSLAVKIAAIVVLVMAYAFASWAMIENAYFSGVVRIQKERGHTVCSSGPYQFMRHPGYSSSLWSYLAMPLILDSAWGFIAVAILLVVTIVRTRLEDRTLQEELPGYREYAQKVKYRLFPGVW